MFNPRFPHSLRIWRFRKDAYGTPMTTEEGEPVLDVVSLDVVVMIDGRPLMDSDNGFATESAEWLDFGYRTEGRNTKDTLDVVVSDFKLATPMFLTPLEVGDRVEVKDYDRTYWAEVVKKHTTNLGSNIWINEVKN